MTDTGIDLVSAASTGIDKKHIKIQLDHKTENNKLNIEFKEKCLEKLFSANFLVFIITTLVIGSGFVFMYVSGATTADIMNHWRSILPVVTTYMGYAIGKGKQNDS